LIGVEAKDVDITTDATPAEVETVIAKHFPSAKILEVGKRFAITIIMIDGVQLEIATFRKESDYSDGRRPDKIELTKNLADDASRRDFTANALYYDPIDDLYVDLYGGAEDIKNRVIKTVGDPTQRFSEDYLRLIRAVRIAHQKGFDIDKETFEAIKASKGDIGRISKERVKDEMDKLLMSDRPGDAVMTLYDSGLLAELFPEVAELHGLPQNPKHHPEGAVLEKHVVNALNISKKNKILRWAIFLHDIGKAPARQEKIIDDEPQSVYHGHEDISVELATNILNKYKFDSTSAKQILWIIKHHGVFLDIINKQISTYELRKILVNPLFDLLLDHYKADRGSSNDSKIDAKTDEMVDMLRSQRDEFLANPKSLDLLSKKNIIDGDVLNSFGIEGKDVGVVLQKIKDDYFNDKLRTKEDAISYFKTKLLPKYLKIDGNDIITIGIEKGMVVPGQRIGQIKNELAAKVASGELQNSKKELLNFLKLEIK
jgi:tRNA nucleotidyltransferase/poly(A) polymerase